MSREARRRRGTSDTGSSADLGDGTASLTSGTSIRISSAGDLGIGGLQTMFGEWAAILVGGADRGTYGASDTCLRVRRSLVNSTDTVAISEFRGSIS